MLLPAVLSSARAARQAVCAALFEWGCVELVEDAGLLVTELVTNSLLHTHSPVGLKLLVRDGMFRAEVSDDDVATPEVRPADLDAATGRGMLIVDRLASTWGVEVATGGKTVWFELPLAVPVDAGCGRRAAPREGGRC